MSGKFSALAAVLTLTTLLALASGANARSPLPNPPDSATTREPSAEAFREFCRAHRGAQTCRAYRQLAANRQAPVDVDLRLVARLFGWSAGLGHGPTVSCPSPARIALPAGAVVRLSVTSEDVIHELRAPGLGVSLDAVPGRLAERRFRVGKAGSRQADVTKASGAGYAAMRIVFDVVAPAAYAALRKQGAPVCGE